MNFAKLFAAGRGLAGGRPGPFRVNQGLLPKFNEDRVGSFHRTTLPAEPREDLFPNARKSELEVAEVRGPEQPAEPAAVQAPLLDESPRPVYRQAVRRRKLTQERLEQAELELQQVRVVRNDLEEADLDVVAVAGPRKPAEGVAIARAGGTVWGWVSETLFKSSAA